MNNDLKPDLVIHPDFAKSLLKFDLNTYFNILHLEDIFASITDINPILVSENKISILKDVFLKPVFDKYLCKKSGFKPQYTSYYFDVPIPIYRIPNRAPRYVIWNETSNLTICATHVDRINEYNIYEAYRRAKDWAYTITNVETIIVFDLDETLIDRKCAKLKDADKLLSCARTIYDRIVLYSHGSNLHVDDNVSKFDKSIFDLILSNTAHDHISNKNLLYLYNYFPNTVFSHATLVDDSLYNWTPEYDKFIVPYKLTSLHDVLSVINTY